MTAEVADVVVVGLGAAGAAAALAAERDGASVLVCEKQPATAHTPSTRMSGGIVMGAADADDATTYLDHCAGGMIPRAVSRAWATAAVGLPDWLTDHGVDVPLRVCGGAEHPELPGADAIVTLQPGSSGTRLDPSGGAGPALWAGLAAATAARPGIMVRHDSPAHRLVVEDGRVAGVRLHGPDGPIVRARHGVVLASGGYEFDDELKRNHLRTWPVHFYGNPGNTGDGVRMAQAVGADLWHMNQMIGRAIGRFPLDDGTEQGFIIGIDPPGYVITDRYGRRFADEVPQARLLHGFYHELLAFDHERGEYPRNPCYWFFDERRRRAGPLTYTHIGACAVGLYDWSRDNQRELDRGWIHSGATVQDAAQAAGVADPDEAARTVATYNEACAAGADAAFGRDPATLIPLDRPPYHCVPLVAGGSNTSGGPRRDEHARVLDVFGQPLPGLLAAGELGQAMGLMYPADGSNISEALCFGRIAAATALAG